MSIGYRINRVGVRYRNCCGAIQDKGAVWWLVKEFGKEVQHVFQLPSNGIDLTQLRY